MTAMQDEMQSLEKNYTWELVNLPKKKKMSVANGFSKERNVSLLLKKRGIKQG